MNSVLQYVLYVGILVAVAIPPLPPLGSKVMVILPVYPFSIIAGAVVTCAETQSANNAKAANMVKIFFIVVLNLRYLLINSMSLLDTVTHYVVHLFAHFDQQLPIAEHFLSP